MFLCYLWLMDYALGSAYLPQQPVQACQFFCPLMLYTATLMNIPKPICFCFPKLPTLPVKTCNMPHCTHKCCRHDNLFNPERFKHHNKNATCGKCTRTSKTQDNQETDNTTAQIPECPATLSKSEVKQACHHC